MLFSQYILRIEGSVNRIFTVVPQTDSRVEGAEKINEERIKEALRHDYENGRVGKYIPSENPSQDPSVVQFYYTPSMAKQKLYARGFPIKMGTYQIIDAFVCLGSRFGLDPLQVYVELCRSDMGDRSYWAYVYYVADSQVPECIIKAEKYQLFLDTDEMSQRIQWDKEEEQMLKKQVEKLAEQERSEFAKEVSSHIGGQMEIRNQREGYIYRGEIAEAIVVDETLVVRFAWMAKGNSYPPEPTQWINDENLDYSASLLVYQASYNADGRLVLISSINSEHVVFYPKGQGKLELSQVRECRPA